MAPQAGPQGLGILKASLAGTSPWLSMMGRPRDLGGATCEVGTSEPPGPSVWLNWVRGLVSPQGAQALAFLRRNSSSRGQMLSTNSTRSQVISPPLLAIAA